MQQTITTVPCPANILEVIKSLTGMYMHKDGNSILVSVSVGSKAINGSFGYRRFGSWENAFQAARKFHQSALSEQMDAAIKREEKSNKAHVWCDDPNCPARTSNVGGVSLARGTAYSNGRPYYSGYNFSMQKSGCKFTKFFGTYKYDSSIEKAREAAEEYAIAFSKNAPSDTIGFRKYCEYHKNDNGDFYFDKKNQTVEDTKTDSEPDIIPSLGDNKSVTFEKGDIVKFNTRNIYFGGSSALSRIPSNSWLDSELVVVGNEIFGAVCVRAAGFKNTILVDTRCCELVKKYSDRKVVGKLLGGIMYFVYEDAEDDPKEFNLGKLITNPANAPEVHEELMSKVSAMLTIYHKN